MNHIPRRGFHHRLPSNKPATSDAALLLSESPATSRVHGGPLLSVFFPPPPAGSRVRRRRCGRKTGQVGPLPPSPSAATAPPAPSQTRGSNRCPHAGLRGNN